MTKLSVIIFLVAGYFLTQTNTQTAAQRGTTARPGSYKPTSYGDNSGRYVPDERGKYKHVTIPAVPYEHVSVPPVPPGGYAYKRTDPYKRVDPYKRTDKYQNKYFSTTPLPPKPKPKIYQDFKSLNLGPKDHLRFMLDFNFNDGGWQIVQFDWNRDDEKTGISKPKYNFVNERKLFDVPQQKLQSHLDGYFYGLGDDDRVHVDGRLDQNILSYNFTETNPKVKIADNANIRETIAEVLDYVKKNVLPKL